MKDVKKVVVIDWEKWQLLKERAKNTRGKGNTRDYGIQTEVDDDDDDDIPVPPHQFIDDYFKIDDDIVSNSSVDLHHPQTNKLVLSKGDKQKQQVGKAGDVINLGCTKTLPCKWLQLK